jgi:hypothetical protein
VPLVQTTMFAHPIEVPDEEIPVLRAQGLLAEPARQPAEGERRYPITEVPDQTAGDASKDDEAETAGKPGTKETK